MSSEEVDSSTVRKEIGIRIAVADAFRPPPGIGRRAKGILILLMLVGTGASLAAAGLELWSFFGERAALEGENRVRAQREMAEAGAEIDEALAEVVPVTDALAARFATGPLPSAAELEETLQRTLDLNPQLHGVGVAFAPFAYDSDQRLFAPYALRESDGTVSSLDVGDQYDYTRYENEWFWSPRFDGARWNEPYYEPSTDQIVIEYGVPVHLPGTDPETSLADAVVFGNFALFDIDARVHEMGFGRSGYGFLFSRDGHFISHPRRDYLRRTQATADGDSTVDTRTIFEIAWARGDTALHTLGVATINGQERIVDYRDPVTGQEAWIVYGPVEGPSWTLASVLLLDDLRPDSDLSRRALLRITALTLVGVACLAFAILLGLISFRSGSPGASMETDSGLEITLWGGAIAFSLMAIVGIVVIWVFALRHPTTRIDDEIRVMDSATLQQEMNREGGVLGGGTVIPTGVFIQSLDIESGVTVLLTGSIWQKYSVSQHEGIARGVVLPEQQELEITEIGRTIRGDTEIVEWSFTGRFRQEFNYERFPLDQHEVWLRMMHPDHRRDVFLAPDLESYPITNPAALPGVAQGLVVPGWEVEGSHFGYREHQYSTNFGDAESGFEAARPELYYNVLVRREFLQPFISTIIPLLVTASMLFATLLLSTKRGEEDDVRGFTAMDVVLSSAALFFVVVFQHIAIRADIPSQSIIYVEYFYFAMYVALLAVSLNAIIFACTSRLRWLQMGDNLVPKVLFWPVYLNVALGITLWAFY